MTHFYEDVSLDDDWATIEYCFLVSCPDFLFLRRLFRGRGRYNKKSWPVGRKGTFMER